MRRASFRSKLPHTLTINGTVYHVVLHSKLINGDLGYFDADSKVIGLSRDQDDSELVASFFHEVIHAFEHEFKFQLRHSIIRKIEYELAGIMTKVFSFDRDA